MADDRYGPVVTPPTPAGAPAGSTPRRRVPGWLVAVAVATAVASVISFAAVLLWPGGGGTDPLEFHRFASVDRIAFDEPTRTAFTAVLGERGYAAWEQGGDLQVVAFDLATGDRAWKQTVTGALQWNRIYAAPGGLLVLANEPDPTQPRRMFVLDPATGEEQWHQDVRGDDQLFLMEGTLGWLDRDAGALRGLNPATGDERWRQELSGDAEPAILPVVSDADLARPADLRGTPSPGPGDDRIVLVHPDRSVLVVDGSDGRILGEGANIADPDDRLLAYQGRLFVAPAELGYQLVSYDLGQLSGVPQALYSAPDPERYPEVLEPCGRGRVCLLENVSFDRATTELVSVDAVDGGERWRAPATGAEQLLAVGDWVAVAASVGFEPSVVVYDGAGTPMLDGAGLVVRLDDGNLLMLTGIGSFTGGVSVAGVAIEDWDGDPVDLGRLPEEVLEEHCSWNDRHIVCPDRAGAEIWQFAGD